MKNALITGIAIVIGFTIHAVLTSPEKPDQVNRTKKSASYGEYRDLDEYRTISKLKQSAVDQLSGLQAKKMTLNGQDYLYMLLVDEKDNGKGVKWTHKLFKLENDSLMKVPFE